MLAFTRPRLRLLARVIAISLCTLLQRAGPSAAQNAATAQRLSQKVKKEVFDKIWKDIRDYYYDPAYNGVNWNDVRQRYDPLVDATKGDQDFYTLMSQMTGELHDAHTRFSSPERWKNYKKQQTVTVGFTAEDVGGKTVVTNVEPESNAARAGVEAGMIVLRVDGREVDQRIAEIEKSRLPSSTERATRWFIYSRVFGGPPGTQLKITLQRADGSSFETVITRQVASDAPHVSAAMLPSGNAYIRFDGFQAPVVKEFRSALEKVRNAPGVVIDLRKNGGGDLSVLLPIASYFFGEKTLFARDATRSGKPLSTFAGVFKLPLELYVGKPGDQIYSGPVTILMDAHSASSSEVFAAGMQDTRRAKIFGTPSCGCVLGIAKPREMKGGGVLEMSEVLWLSPKGRKLEGTGIIPDAMIVPTLSDFQQKRDSVLAAADRTLQAMSGNLQPARR